MSQNSHATPESNTQDALAHEHLPVGKIALVGVVSVVIFAIGIWLSKVELDYVEATARETQGAPTDPSEIGKPELGIVDQQLFELEHRQKDELKKQQSTLDHGGSSPQGTSTTYTPIDEAMKQVVAEQKK